MTESLEERKGFNVWVGSRSESGNVHLNVDVVARDDLLSANCANLNLDIHNAEGLRANVDLHETGVDGLVELSESSDQTDRAFAFR